jgi:hypothetical protein
LVFGEKDRFFLGLLLSFPEAKVMAQESPQ